MALKQSQSEARPDNFQRVLRAVIDAWHPKTCKVGFSLRYDLHALLASHFWCILTLQPANVLFASFAADQLAARLESIVSKSLVQDLQNSGAFRVVGKRLSRLQVACL